MIGLQKLPTNNGVMRSRKRKYIISTSCGDHIYITSNTLVQFKPYDPDEGTPPTLWIGGLSGTEFEFEDDEVTFEEVPNDT